MKNRKRITNILIAGTLTAMLLAVFLAFRGGSTTAAGASSDEQTAVIEDSNAAGADVASLQAQIENLLEQNAAYQAQNEELRAAVQTLQEREREYQVQIETANETINEFAGQGSSIAEGFGSFPARPHEHNH